MKNSTHKKLYIFLALAVILLCVIAFSSHLKEKTAVADSQSNYPYAYDNSEIIIDIDENKILHVTEKLKVGFTANTGVFERRVPGKAQSVKNKKGKEKKGRSFLAEIQTVGVKIDGEEGEISCNRNGSNNYIRCKTASGKQFKAWDKTDNKKYDIELEYICDFSQDEDGHNALCLYFFEEVYTKWFYYNNDKSDVSKLTVTINMPKPLDGVFATVATDGEKQRDGVAVNGNTVSFTVDYVDICDKSVRILLPDGYFKTSAKVFPFYWIFVSIVGGLMLVALVITFIFRQRTPLAPVEYLPPILNPVHFSAHWHGHLRRKDAATVLLRWAKLGCIRIKKVGKKDVEITKLKNLPEGRTKGEYEYFNALFENGDVYRSEEVRKNRSHKGTIARATSMLIEDAGMPVTYAKGTEAARVVVMILSNFTLLVTFVYFIIISDNLIFLSLLIMLALFICFGLTGALKAINKGFGVTKYSSRLFFAISKFMPLIALGPVFLMSAILFSVQYMSLYDYIYLIVISVIWIAISYNVLPYFISKRSEESQKIYGEMVGFKKFLTLAKVPEMEIMLEENPDYYLDVLPYCMIMGLSKKLDKKTRFLQAPDWADNFDSATFAASLNSLFKKSVAVRSKKEKKNEK